MSELEFRILIQQLRARIDRLEERLRLAGNFA